MSDSPNITLVRRLYDSGMAPEVTAEIIAPDLVWDITPGFPNGGIYHGWDSVGRDFFGQMMPSYESFAPRAEQFFADNEDHVFVLGPLPRRHQDREHRGRPVHPPMDHSRRPARPPAAGR